MSSGNHRAPSGLLMICCGYITPWLIYQGIHRNGVWMWISFFLPFLIDTNKKLFNIGYELTILRLYKVSFGPSIDKRYFRDIFFTNWVHKD